MSRPSSRARTRLVASIALFVAVTRNRRLARATAAFFAFDAVDFGQWTAILVYAYLTTGPLSVGLVGLLELVPAAVAAPLTAAFGDRYPRERVLLVSYLVQAASLALTGAAMLLAADPLLVYSLSIAGQVALTATRPLHNALLPVLSDSADELTAGNALTSIAEGAGALAGPAAVAAILAVASPGPAFLVSSGALLLAAVLVVRLRPREEVGGSLRAGVAPAHFAALDGLRAAIGDPDLRIVMSVLAGRMFVLGGLEVLLVLAAIELLGLGESGVGLLMAALGTGTVIGGASTVALAGRRRLTPWLAAGATVVGVPVLLLGVAPVTAAAVALLAVAGVGMALLDVTGRTLLQRVSADQLRARVFGVLEGVLVVGEAVGSFAVVPVAGVVGLRGALVVFGVALPLAALALTGRFARIDARGVVPEREIAALQRVGLFAPVPAPALEALARHLVAVERLAGTVVIREGDAGDRFYLVLAGRLSVTGGGRVLATFGPGDYFGEIALLRDVPRTATVTAETDVELFALDREPFLAAMTGNAALLAATDRVATVRLEDRLAAEAAPR